MIGKKMLDAINEQIKNEMYSANLYLAMAVDFDGRGLSGFADFMYEHVKEEEMHAMKFVKYVLDVGGKPVISAIPKPDSNFKSGTDMVRRALGHEKKVTAMINNLLDIAEREKDRSAQQFLQWYVAEQVEEESLFDSVLKMCEQAGEKNLFMVEDRLAGLEGGEKPSTESQT